MNRTRASSVDAFGTRDQRNRIYPALEASDGSTLSLDFTQMSSLDSRFTFSRNTQGTFINSSGYVAWSDVNLVRDSIGFAVTSATSRGWGLPAGATTSLVNDRNGVSSNASRTSYTQSGSAAVTWSPDSSAVAATGVVARFWIRGVTNASRIDVGWYQSTLGWGVASDGSCTIVGGYSSGVTINSQTGVLFRVENLSTTEWTQLEVKRSTRFDYFAMYFGGAAATGLAHAFEFSDFQINLGTVAKPFVATSNAGGAGLQAPRFDYDPTTRAPRGLLIEGSASNLMTHSEDQGNNTTWNAFGSSVTRTTGQTDPGNNSTANKLVFDATTADAVISRSVTVSNATQYTISMWMRADSGTVTNVRFARAAGSAGAIFPTLTTAWQRVQLTFTSSTTSDGIEIRVLNSGSPQTATVHLWGAQLEAGTGASSYIPTGTATVTRAADKLTMSNIALMQWNQTAGTFLWDMDVQAETSTSSFAPAFAGMYRAGPVRVIRFQLNNSSGTNPRIGSDTWTATPSSIVATSLYTRPVGTPFKAAVAFANTGQSMTYCINGTVQTTVTGTGTLATPTLFLMHQDPSAGDTEYFPIHLRQLKYWPTNLSSSDLRSITT